MSFSGHVFFLQYAMMQKLDRSSFFHKIETLVCAATERSDPTQRSSCLPNFGTLVPLIRLPLSQILRLIINVSPHAHFIDHFNYCTRVDSQPSVVYTFHSVLMSMHAINSLSITTVTSSLSRFHSLGCKSKE